MFIGLTGDMNEESNDLCLDYSKTKRLSDSEVKAIILEQGIFDKNQLLRLERPKRDEIIRALKPAEGVTIRQLSRITGISKSVINRA